jgi:hypothetical protein
LKKVFDDENDRSERNGASDDESPAGESGNAQKYVFEDSMEESEINAYDDDKTEKNKEEL